MTDQTTVRVDSESETCPVQDDRKMSEHIPHPLKPIVVDDDGMWHIHGYDEGRQILRSMFVKQAGFKSEDVAGRIKGVMKNMPILYLDGEEHNRMRRETNRFFTPTITDKQYRDFMEQYADELVNKLKTKRRASLKELTAEMAQRVASQVIGLTDSLLPGLGARVDGVLSLGKAAGTPSMNLLYFLVLQRHLLSFLWLDVKPAIRKRRAEPKQDVISYLICRNYSDLEILTECVVYGVAGMATTREYMCVALWHLLEKPHLRQRMLVGSQEERYAILHEILRLEPVVGHLRRRVTETFEIESEGKTVTIPAGVLLDLNIYMSNIDPETVGEDGTAVCPARPLNSPLGKVSEAVLSFGDGAHRCVGMFIAIQESDIFLRKMLALETLRIERAPKLVYNGTISGHEVHDFIVTLD